MSKTKNELNQALRTTAIPWLVLIGSCIAVHYAAKGLGLTGTVTIAGIATAVAIWMTHKFHKLKDRVRSLLDYSDRLEYKMGLEEAKHKEIEKVFTDLLAQQPGRKSQSRTEAPIKTEAEKLPGEHIGL
jgi:hypothetical protein